MEEEAPATRGERGDFRDERTVVTEEWDWGEDEEKNIEEVKWSLALFVGHVIGGILQDMIIVIVAQKLLTFL